MEYGSSGSSLHNLIIKDSQVFKKISYKIRENSLKKIPFQLILGKNEIKERSITMRVFGSDKQEKIKFVGSDHRSNVTEFKFGADFCCFSQYESNKESKITKSGALRHFFSPLKSFLIIASEFLFCQLL
mgnify:CR=1 FL=1